jgi:hypothetical protein
MFTWVPRYDEMTVAEKIKIRTPEDWMVAVHPGTYDVETDAQALKAAGRSLGEIRDVLASLPRGARMSSTPHGRGRRGAWGEFARQYVRTDGQHGHVVRRRKRNKSRQGEQENKRG